ncbi:MAG: glycosyltransferase family 2 protein [Patescibacteria group bacterium]|jgi:hypothetical protein
METDLTVIIPTYNNLEGLQYLLNYFKDKEFKVIVVGNGLDPRLRGDDTGNLVYLPQEKNLGFAGGVNKGAKDVKTKWMLILNDDIRFDKKITNNKSQITNEYQILNNKKIKQNPIESLIKYAEENNLDAVSPILKNPNGEVENYGYKVLPYGKVELIKENYRLDPRLREDDNASIDGLTAACLLVKTEVFKKLGGFDESFFAYLEDVDFFLRMKKMDSRLRGNDKLSFGIAYDIEVIHNHMTTSLTMGNFKAKQDMINWWRLYFKHPEKFKFNLDFIIERMRNVSGFVKATFYSI